jgi:hypothetical protein
VVEVLAHGTVNPWGHDWDEHGELFFINTVIGHMWHMIPGFHYRESGSGASQNSLIYERMPQHADHFHYDTNLAWAQVALTGRLMTLGAGMLMWEWRSIRRIIFQSNGGIVCSPGTSMAGGSIGKG